MGTVRTSPPSIDEVASMKPMDGIPIQLMIDRWIAVTLAPVSTSPETEYGGRKVPPPATSVFAS